jgi:hypothetical protein
MLIALQEISHMKTILKFYAVVLIALVACVPAQAQSSVTQTTLGAAVTSTSNNRVSLASTTNVIVGTVLFIDNEELVVESLVGGGAVQVQRGAGGTRASGHVSGAGVIVGPPQAFVVKDPQGSCTAGVGPFQYTPVVNVTNGLQWLCSLNGHVAPGWGNSLEAPNTTTPVSSAAGPILPSGPLFHTSGVAAITGFTIPVGFDPSSGQSFTIIADSVFSWTAAGNIALASATVVPFKTYTFTWDPNLAKFYPSTQ